MNGGGVFDEDAFAAFYNRTSTALWRYLRRAGGDETVADDLLQESYVKFLGRWAGGSPGGERQQTAYLYRIASNLLRDRWRHEKREESWLASLFASRPVAGEPTGRLDLKVDLDSMLAALKGRERALLWLAYVEGYDHREIAEILGLAAGSVRVLLYRARGKAAAALEEHGRARRGVTD